MKRYCRRIEEHFGDIYITVDRRYSDFGENEHNEHTCYAFISVIESIYFRSSLVSDFRYKIEKSNSPRIINTASTAVSIVWHATSRHVYHSLQYNPVTGILVVTSLERMWLPLHKLNVSKLCYQESRFAYICAARPKYRMKRNSHLMRDVCGLLMKNYEHGWMKIGV